MILVAKKNFEGAVKYPCHSFVERVRGNAHWAHLTGAMSVDESGSANSEHIPATQVADLEGDEHDEDAEYHEVAVAVVYLGHADEVHPVDPRYEAERKEESRCGGQCYDVG